MKQHLLRKQVDLESISRQHKHSHRRIQIPKDQLIAGEEMLNGKTHLERTVRLRVVVGSHCCGLLFQAIEEAEGLKLREDELFAEGVGGSEGLLVLEILRTQCDDAMHLCFG